MKENKLFKKNFIWNIVGTTFNALNSLFFMIVVTRINGINEGGIFTIAFSTACILYVIGIYSGRIFQVTDTNMIFNDKEYFFNRITSCLFMMIITLCFVLFKKYDLHKSLIFVLLSFFKCLEAFSDVLYGIMQKNDFLDKVGKSYFIKALLCIICFSLVDYFTKNLILSCIVIILLYIFIILVYDLKNIKGLINTNPLNIKNSMKIFSKGFFVFIITFFGLYILNSPKYAIDIFLTEDIQAIFGIILMPATVMGLVGQFLIYPYLNIIVNLYNKKNLLGINKLLKKIVLYIILFAFFASILAYFLGIPVLNYIYGINLSEYQLHLVIIIISATIYNIGIIYSSVLTTMRYTFIQFLIYTIVSIFALIISNMFTAKMGINGSVLSYFCTMLLQFTFYLIAIKVILNKILKKRWEILDYDKHVIS